MPPINVAMPTGRILASVGMLKPLGEGYIVDIIIENPIIATTRPRIIPFIVAPCFIKKRSRKPEAKQSLLRCKVNPTDRPIIQKTWNVLPKLFARTKKRLKFF